MLSIHWTRRHRCARIVCDTTPRHVKPCNGASFTCNCKLKIPMIHTFEVISKNEAIALAQCTYVICIIMTRHVNQNQSSTSPTWSSCKRSHVVFCYLRHINIFARWGNTKKKTEYNIFMDLIKPSPHQPSNKNWQLQWIADALRQKFWPSHTERLIATGCDALWFSETGSTRKYCAKFTSRVRGRFDRPHECKFPVLHELPSSIYLITC